MNLRSTIRHLVRAFTAAVATACGLMLAAPTSLSAAPLANVAAIRATGAADLVLLDHGFDAGLRQGMVCRVTRARAEIAEIVVVGVRENCGAALITSLSPKQSIRAGDLVGVKILKT
ncbi:MAG: hypothetical protein RLZZ15_1661 [Verrucomicrobiota bacterium]|jgi:hypothetical protein